MAEMLASVRRDLPALREVVSFADWDAFCASGAPSEQLPAVDPRAIAQIQYTSGTTGRPKGAALHHRAIVNNAIVYIERLELPLGSLQISPMPLFHPAGCRMSGLRTLANQGPLVLPPALHP